jgi:hypothetical protein
MAKAKQIPLRLNLQTTLFRLNMSVSGAEVKRVTEGDQQFLVAPVVALKAGVRNGEMVPANEIARSVEQWEGMPITVGHPNGDGISPQRYKVLSEQLSVGEFRNVHLLNGDSLAGEIWLRLPTASAEAANIVKHLETCKVDTCKVIEVSTAYAADGIRAEGELDGKKFNAIQSNLWPVHLALLPDETGACSVADGCGTPRVNADKKNSIPDGVKLNGVRLGGLLNKIVEERTSTPAERGELLQLLADAADISETKVQQILDGKVDLPPIHWVRKFSALLDVPEYILSFAASDDASDFIRSLEPEKEIMPLPCGCSGACTCHKQLSSTTESPRESVLSKVVANFADQATLEIKRARAFFGRVLGGHMLTKEQIIKAYAEKMQFNAEEAKFLEGLDEKRLKVLAAAAGVECECGKTKTNADEEAAAKAAADKAAADKAAEAAAKTNVEKTAMVAGVSDVKPGELSPILNAEQIGAIVTKAVGEAVAPFKSILDGLKTNAETERNTMVEALKKNKSHGLSDATVDSLPEQALRELYAKATESRANYAGASGFHMNAGDQNADDGLTVESLENAPWAGQSSVN